MEQNKALTRRILEEVFNQKDWAAFDDLIASDYIDHTGVEGKEGYRALLKSMFKAFPDLQGTIEEMIAEGDQVAVFVRFRATHQGEILGIAPTGREVRWVGMGILRYAGGQLKERKNVSDLLGLMQQLGAVKPPE